MLRRLLKYDIRYVFRYLWILALASLGGSLIGGLSIGVLERDNFASEHRGYIFAILGICLAVFVIVALVFAAMMFCYYRFYQNFYSDEGYLTFTLPVRRCDLLNSKLVSTFTASVSAIVVVILDVFLMCLIGYGDKLGGIIGEVAAEIAALRGVDVLYFIISVIEILLIVVGSIILSTLIVFMCISLSSMITKKYRVILGIAIAYVVSGILSSFMYFLLGYGSVSVGDIFSMIPDEYISLVTVIFLFCVMALIYLLSAIVYTVEYRLLDKHLNLS